jgi:hypothetical protein
MRFGFVDACLVAIYGTTDASDVEWDGYLAEVRRGACTTQLITTGGGAPTRRQRWELRTVLDVLATREELANERRARRPTTRRIPTAILTDRMVSRLKLALFGIFDPAWEVRAFAPSALSDALAHLAILSGRAPLIERELGRLRREARVERRYLELLAPCPEAQHCGTTTACALWSERVGRCACGCAGCEAAAARLAEARDEEVARDTTIDPEFGLWLLPRLRKIEASVRLPKPVKGRVLPRVLDGGTR